MRLCWFSAGGALPLPLAGEGWGHLIGMNVGPRICPHPPRFVERVVPRLGACEQALHRQAREVKPNSRHAPPASPPMPSRAALSRTTPCSPNVVRTTRAHQPQRSVSKWLRF
jgi:hypothetical protein